MIDVRTSRSSVNRDRPAMRRESAIGALRRLESALDDENSTPFERVELLEGLTAADRHAVQRVVGDEDRHAGLVLEAGVEAVEQRAAAGEHDALLHDVGGELRRRLVERDLHGVDDGRRPAPRCASRISSVEVTMVFGQAGDEVAARGSRRAAPRRAATPSRGRS